MNMKPVIPAFLGVAMLAVLAAPAAARTKDDIRDLQERMTRVEQRAAAQGAATVRVNELERQIQQLTGRIEELTYELEQANRRLDAVSAALSGGDGAGEGVQPGALYDAPGGVRSRSNRSGPVDLSTGDPIADQIRSEDAQSSGASASSGAGGSAPAIELPLNPDAAYDYASGFLLEGDYERAKAAFQLYVEAFPNHPRTPDARFRLGEIHLALGENAAAADVFIAHIRNYPNDPRAAEAYLKLGTAFSRLEKPDEACTVFQTMKTKFPNAAGPVMQRADLEMARIDCQ